MNEMTKQINVETDEKVRAGEGGLAETKEEGSVQLAEHLESLVSQWDSPGKNTEVGCHALLQGDLHT